MWSRALTVAVSACLLASCASFSSGSRPSVRPPLKLVPPVEEAAKAGMGPMDYLILLMDAHEVNCPALSVIRKEDPSQCRVYPLEEAARYGPEASILSPRY